MKRIICLSCKATHAVMPCDLVPYKLLSLFVVIFILRLFYISQEPVLRIAAAWGFSFQFVYSVLAAFRRHSAGIYMYFRELSGGAIPVGLGGAGIISLVRKPYAGFQSGYIKSNKRPCFMCKFFNSADAPPIGRTAPYVAPRGATT